MIGITGLWAGKDKNGNSYMSGNLGNARLMIFKNTKKTEDKQPDYIVYLDERKKKEEDTKGESTQPTAPEDDLPF